MPSPLYWMKQTANGLSSERQRADPADSSQIASQVDVAYRNLIQSRRLVEAYRAGVLEDARLALTIVEKAYERGGATILDLLDAARTSRTIQQNYIETLYNYQRNIFQLESAVGREIT